MYVHGSGCSKMFMSLPLATGFGVARGSVATGLATVKVALKTGARCAGATLPQ